MSDRIAVMHEGRVDQVGTPREIYEGPATLFVADFLGVANVMDVEVVTSDGTGCRLRVGERELRAECDFVGTGAASAVVRPERLRVAPHDEVGENHIPGMIDRTIYVGSNLTSDGAAGQRRGAAGERAERRGRPRLARAGGAGERSRAA